MAHYPKIATVHYKSKALNFSLDIRAQYIEVPCYVCGPCNLEVSFKEIMAYISKHEKDMKQKFPNLVWEYRELAGYRHLPIELIVDKSVMYCPACYRKEQTMVRLKPKKKSLIKLYTCGSPEYVKVNEIISHHLGGRWNEDELWIGHGRTKLVSFYDNLTNAKNALSLVHMSPTKRKKKQFIIDIHKVTKKQLKEEWTNYRKRVFIKRL